MLLAMPTAFAHTHCISPSVCLLKSFTQASTFAPSPFSARASAIRSRTCGRQRLAFLAASATGGARKPNPSEGGEGAPAPYTEFAKVRTAVKPAGRAALIRHGAAQKRRAMPPSPRGRLRRRSKAKPVSGFLFMRSALTVGIKSKSPPCSNEHGGLF